MKKTPIHAPSLAQHFDAPLDQVAEFGWVCGYSADATFLDNALERFTRQSHAQRAWLGRPWMGLVLDRGNPAISPTDVPGLAHFRQRAGAKRWFHLMHAKVALLGFRKQDDPTAWRLRLIVSTGNWTRQTVEESLDLAWRVDVRAADLRSGDPAALQAVADVAQAWRFFERLLPLVDDRLPGGDGVGAAAVAGQARARVVSWLESCTRVRGKPMPRFFDSHDRSLLAQLPGLVKEHAGAQRRNYLAMGSGYFEAPATDGAFPAVPLAVRATLQGEGLLTQSPEVDLFVNPKACQAIAATREDALEAAAMTIRAPRAPAAIFGASRARSLHAKFIFSANSGRGDQTCASPWLYLGSGNLTGAGFTHPDAKGRNLEAGVVLGLSDLCWYAKDARGPDRRAVEHLLPVGWEENELSLKEIVSGDPFPERAEESLAPPVPWLQWEPAPPGGLLRAPSGLDDTTAQPDYEVLDPEGHACARDGADAFRWPGERPREVDLRWTPDGKARRIDRIPVLDECGRVAATPLPTLDLEAARWQLLDFPNAPEPDEAEGDVGGPPDGILEGAGRASAGAAKGYPIRDMMALIELIADRQTRIAEPDWAAWCARLEQTLVQTADDPAVSAFRALKLNPLQPLRLPPFRPTYAEFEASEAGKCYDELLDRIERAWNVADLPPIGEAQ
jgi:hypothetical protein